MQAVSSSRGYEANKSVVPCIFRTSQPSLAALEKYAHPIEAMSTGAISHQLLAQKECVKLKADR